MEILTNRIVLGAAAAALISVCSGTLYADSMFGVVGSPIDLSANVQEAILPGVGTIFQQSMPLFGTLPDPKQSAELLHISDVGVITQIGWHTSTTSAFASSLAESDGNGGVGVSQIILGSAGTPGGSDQVIRQLVAQSLWTQTFLYLGTPTVDLKLHLEIPMLLTDLWLIPP